MANGEGSRGGKIIGHYRSGKAKYDSDGDRALQVGAGLSGAALALIGGSKGSQFSAMKAHRAKILSRKAALSARRLVENFPNSNMSARSASRTVAHNVQRADVLKKAVEWTSTKKIAWGRVGAALGVAGLGVAAYAAKEAFDNQDEETQHKIKEVLTPGVGAALATTAVVALNRRKVARLSVSSFKRAYKLMRGR